MSSVVLATAGYDHTIRFWEATSGVCYRTLQFADSQVNKLEISADKTQIAAAGNSQIRIFDVNSNDAQPINSYDGHSGNVTSLGFQKDSKWMYSGQALHRNHIMSTCVERRSLKPWLGNASRWGGWNGACMGFACTWMPTCVRE